MPRTAAKSTTKKSAEKPKVEEPKASDLPEGMYEDEYGAIYEEGRDIPFILPWDHPSLKTED